MNPPTAQKTIGCRPPDLYQPLLNCCNRIYMLHHVIIVMLKHSEVSVMVADGLVPTWCHGIYNHHDDVGVTICAGKQLFALDTQIMVICIISSLSALLAIEQKQIGVIKTLLTRSDDTYRPNQCHSQLPHIVDTLSSSTLMYQQTPVYPAPNSKLHHKRIMQDHFSQTPNCGLQAVGADMRQH